MAHASGPPLRAMTVTCGKAYCLAKSVVHRQVSGIGDAKREPDRGRSPDTRSHAHANCDTAEVRGIAGDWVYQGQKRDPSGSGLQRESAELRRAAFLGAGFFVSTLGRDEAVIREYIRGQEEQDRRDDQLSSAWERDHPEGGSKPRGRVSVPAQPL